VAAAVAEAVDEAEVRARFRDVRARFLMRGVSWRVLRAARAGGERRMRRARAQSDVNVRISACRCVCPRD